MPQDYAVPFSSYFPNAPADFQAAVGLVDLLRPRLRQQRKKEYGEQANYLQQARDVELKDKQGASGRAELETLSRLAPFVPPISLSADGQPVPNPVYNQFLQRFGLGGASTGTVPGTAEAQAALQLMMSKRGNQPAVTPEAAAQKKKVSRETVSGTVNNISDSLSNVPVLSAIAEFVRRQGESSVATGSGQPQPRDAMRPPTPGWQTTNPPAARPALPAMPPAPPMPSFDPSVLMQPINPRQPLSPELTSATILEMLKFLQSAPQ